MIILNNNNLRRGENISAEEMVLQRTKKKLPTWFTGKLKKLLTTNTLHSCLFVHAPLLQAVQCSPVYDPVCMASRGLVSVRPKQMCHATNIALFDV